jgi:hypothetical protein
MAVGAINKHAITLIVNKLESPTKPAIDHIYAYGKFYPASNLLAPKLCGLGVGCRVKFAVGAIKNATEWWCASKPTGTLNVISN